MGQYDLAKKAILKYLVRHKCWNKKHTPIENIRKGFPKNLRGSKEVNKAVEELFAEGLILRKPTGHGLDVYLNSHKKAEIEKLTGIG
ncbi:MAG: hypothetical protein AABX70_07355 [Nanoarchaeota archaeon]